jgi:hypothetical protein
LADRLSANMGRWKLIHFWNQNSLMTETAIESPEVAKKPALTPEEQRKLVDEAIERLDRLAESELDMAQLFIAKGKTEIARRRLQELIERYAKSDSAKEAKRLLKTF